MALIRTEGGGRRSRCDNRSAFQEAAPPPAMSRRPAVRHAPEDLPEVVLLGSQVKQGHSVVSGLTGAPRMLECGLRCSAKCGEGARWQEDSSPPAALRQGWKNKVKAQTVNTVLFPWTSRRVAALHRKQTHPAVCRHVTPRVHVVSSARREAAAAPQWTRIAVGAHPYVSLLAAQAFEVQIGGGGN